MKKLGRKSELESVKAELEEERKLFVGGPVVIFKWKAGDYNVPVEYVSPNVKDVFGYTPEEFISGKIVYDDIIHPDDRERVIVEAQSYRRRGILQFEQEYRIITADGKYRWIHDFTTVKKDGKGKIVRYHGYLIDITGRKEMEEALKESEEKYRTLVEKANDGICIVQDGILKYANPRTYEMSGYKVNELIGKKFIQFVIPEEKEKLLQRYKKRIAGEKIEEMYETTFLKKDGSRLYAQITVSMVDYEGKPAELVIIRDITKIKKMEIALKKSEEKYRTIIETSNDGVISIDEKGKIVFINESAEKMFGYNNEELVGKPLTLLMPKEYRRRYIETLKKRLRKKAGKLRRIIEVEGLKKNDEIFPVEFSISSYKIEDSINFIAIARDFTERKKMEKALKKERAQLLSIFEGVDELIYVADPGTYEILYVNRTMKKEFGSDIIGKKCYEIFQKLDKPCDFCTNDKIFGKNFGKTYIWEFQNKKTGKWYRCIDRGITWHDGRKVRLEIAIDITDMVEAEEETKRALELEKQFKLEAAHYFFNPIAIAKGYLSLAMEKASDEDQVEKLKAAEHAIERVEKVVKNVTQKGEIYE